MKGVPLFDLYRQANISTENRLLVFFNYIWQDFPDTGISTRSYIIFYLGGPIDHETHVPVPVSQ